MSSLNYSSNVYEWLASQQIKVPRDWIDACLEWLGHENNIQQLTMAQLQKQVYAQWLMTDVRELSTASLPVEVHSEKYTLTGMYCMQVDSVIDISQPLYGQLLQLQNHDNSNSTVSAETQATQKPWEAKPSRMLMLKLTDGVTEVHGMEYRPIPCVNANLTPGCKIRVRGPICCRRGVLMLAGRNVQLLGGEVEEFSVSNSREAVICQQLGRPPPLPQTDHENSSLANAQPNNPLDDELPQDLISQLTDDDFHTETESGYITGSLPTSSVTPSSVSQSANQQSSVIDDVTDMDILQEMERVESQQTQGSNVVQSPVLPQDGLYQGRSSSNEAFNQTNTNQDIQLHHSAIMDLMDDDFKLPCKPAKCAASKQLSIEDAFNQNFKPLSDHLQAYASNPVCNDIRATSSKPRASESRNNRDGALKVQRSSPHVSGNETRHEPIQPIGCSLPNSSFDNSKECPSLFSRLRVKKNAESTPNNLETSTSTLLTSDIMPINPASDTEKRFDEDCDSRCATNKETLLYLCQVKPRLSRNGSSRVSFTIKAYVVTLLTKLQTDPNTGWCAKALICDGTEVLNVQFSNEVLTALIGFTAKQAEEIKRGTSTSDQASLRKGMMNCRESFVKMCRLMRIEKSPDNVDPIVKQLSDADETYWEELKMRTWS